MSKDGQDDKNVNNDQVQLYDKTNSNIQEQQENTSINNDTLTPEAVTSPSNANIAGAQNTVHITHVSNEVQKPEVTTNDHVENEEKSVNNEQGQSQLDINIGGNQNKAAQSNQEDKEVKSELDKLLSRIDKGEPPHKLEDAQVRNVLGAIKAQLTATANPAELARLASAAASLASSTNNPEILEQIKGIQAVIAKKEETAEQIISSDIAADNLEVQEPIEHTEHKANIAKYADIKADFHKKLDEDLELLDAAIDPSRATPEQRRILEDDLTDAEREELKRKAQLKKEGYEHVYNIKEHAEKEIEQNNTKITEFDERLKTTKDNNQIQSLEAEKQQYIRTNEERQKELDAHVKNELAKRDKERKKLAEFTKLKERVEKYPTTAKRFVREHFELHAAEYDKNPDLTAINELHAMVRKVGLAKELGVAPDPQEIEPIPNINEKQEVVKQDLNKAINQVHEQYSGPVPREATDKIANIILHNEGYPHHREIMKIENMDKTKEQKLIKSINPPIILGQLNPSNTPNKPTKGQDIKIV